MNSFDIITLGLAVLAGAFIMEYALGDPPTRWHPTASLGNFISRAEKKMRNDKPRRELMNGVLLALGVVIAYAAVFAFVQWFVNSILGIVGFLFASVILLKLTFSMRRLEKHAWRVHAALMKGDIPAARREVSYIVRRNTEGLSPALVASATLESIAESTVDGVTSTLFYYGLLGIPGAAAYRAINTLDSTVGYLETPHIHIGRPSALLDTAANYVPARLTGVIMILAGKILGYNSREAWNILKRDKSKTPSRNAGWPIAALAGLLGVRLEKIGHYQIGDSGVELNAHHIPHAVRIMRLTVFLFTVIVTVPLILIEALP